MILDQQLTLTTASVTAVSGGEGTAYNSTDIIDLGPVLRDVAEGDVLKLIFIINSTFAGGSGSSVTFELCQCDAAGYSGNVEAVQFIASLSGGSITAGTTRIHYLQPPFSQLGNTFRRFWFLRARGIGSNAFTLTNSVPNTATLYIAIDKQDGRTFYPSGFKFSV